jgi:hypothetical protein
MPHLSETDFFPFHPFHPFYPFFHFYPEQDRLTREGNLDRERSDEWDGTERSDE